MTEVVENRVPTLAQIERLQHELAQVPQAELETEHYFSGGMYCRKLIAPAGLLVVGKMHKKEHFFMCAKGQIIAWSDNGMVTLNEGDVLCSKSGTKRVILSVTDSIYVTFHKTNKLNLDKIEKELIQPEGLALFDANNKLKVLALEGE
jgi:mannose-6-phosphate isomerase-like protein (cupin superfamily)